MEWPKRRGSGDARRLRTGSDVSICRNSAERALYRIDIHAYSMLQRYKPELGGCLRDGVSTAAPL